MCQEGSAVSFMSVDHKRIDVILILIWIISVFGLTLSLIREWEEHSYNARRARNNATPPTSRFCGWSDYLELYN